MCGHSIVDVLREFGRKLVTRRLGQHDRHDSPFRHESYSPYSRTARRRPVPQFPQRDDCYVDVLDRVLSILDIRNLIAAEFLSEESAAFSNVDALLEKVLMDGNCSHPLDTDDHERILRIGFNRLAGEVPPGFFGVRRSGKPDERHHRLGKTPRSDFGRRDGKTGERHHQLRKTSRSDFFGVRRNGKPDERHRLAKTSRSGFGRRDGKTDKREYRLRRATRPDCVWYGQ